MNEPKRTISIEERQYTTGEHEIIHGRPHGFLWRKKWVVSVTFHDIGEAEGFMNAVEESWRDLDEN